LNSHYQSNQLANPQTTMLTTIPFEQDNIVGVRFDGKIELADFGALIPDLERRFETHRKLRIYAEFTSFSGMSFSALLADMNFSFHHPTGFEKEAIVTDKKWLGRASEMVARLYPPTEVKAFSLDEAEAAKRWIAE